MDDKSQEKEQQHYESNFVSGVRNGIKIIIYSNSGWV